MSLLDLIPRQMWTLLWSVVSQSQELVSCFFSSYLAEPIPMILVFDDTLLVDIWRPFAFAAFCLFLIVFLVSLMFLVVFHTILSFHEPVLILDIELIA